MTEPDLESALRPVIEVCERLGIDYRIGGSVASAVLGVPRSTIDADVACAIELHHTEEFVAALLPTFHVDRDRVVESTRNHSSFNLIHLETMIKIDVFVRRPRAFDEACFRRQTVRPIGQSPDSRTYRFVTAEDIILLKLEWYRQGGRCPNGSGKTFSAC